MPTADPSAHAILSMLPTFSPAPTSGGTAEPPGDAPTPEPIVSAEPPAPSVHPSAEPSPLPPAGELDLDNLTWSIVTDPFDSSSNNYVRGLFTNSNGRVTAWGTYQNGSERGTAFWSTVGGQDWSEDLVTTPGSDIWFSDVTEAPPGYLGVADESGYATAWTSADGLTWTRASIDLEPTVESAYLSAVASGTGGHLFVGSAGGDDDSRLAGWFSPTGLEWTRIDIDMPNGWFVDVTRASHEGFVAVGVDHSSERQSAAIWRVSGDGKEWTKGRVQGRPGMEEMNYVIPLRDGYVGYGMYAPPGETTSCKGCYWSPDLWRAYTSTDGIDWTRHQITGSGSATPAFPWDGAITPWKDGLLAVGRDEGSSNRVWLSDDGVTWEAIGGSLGPSSTISYFDVVVSGDAIFAGGMSLNGGVVAIGRSP
jgi:hypothetical protein